MKNRYFFKFIMLLTAAVCSTSCEKYVVDEESGVEEPNSMLVVRTRAALSDGTEPQEQAKVSYPVNVYVFDEGGKCVELAEITSGDDEMSFKLPEGDYDVYAIAGATESAYEMPTKENATKTSVITLREGCGHGDLMTADSNVALSKGEENTLTLSLERKVMMVESVTIGNVPDDVTAVSVSISPLYEDLLLDGTYSGGNGSGKIDLVETSDGSTWMSETGLYLLEAAGKATLKISLTRNGAVHSYSYSCAEDLKANYKVNINGTYAGDGIDVSGTITGAAWAGTINVDFTFDEDGGTIVPPTPPVGNAPAVGTLYKDCYVLKSENLSGKTVVTLFTTECMRELDFVKGDQESMESAVYAGIAGLAVDGIDGWRLPTVEELDYVCGNAEPVNRKLKEYGKEIFNIDTYGIYSYYCLDEGMVKVYTPYRKSFNENPNTGLATLVLRGFATVEFAE